MSNGIFFNFKDKMTAPKKTNNFLWIFNYYELNINWINNFKTLKQIKSQMYDELLLLLF